MTRAQYSRAIPTRVRGPDVVYYLKDKDYDELNPKFSEDVPDLAVEVLSPSDRIGKVTKRINEFLKAGMKMVWLIDPDGRDVTVYRPSQEVLVLDETDDITGGDVLPAFRCSVADFFFMVKHEAERSKPSEPDPSGHTSVAVSE